MPRPTIQAHRTLRVAGMLAFAALVAGCAGQSAPGYYETPRESTLSDAQHQARGRGDATAPSQIQLGFGDTAEETAGKAAEEDADAAPGLPAPLRRAGTFLGTVPCLEAGGNCPAQRLTLTLAPSGEWRARTEYLPAGEQPPLVQRGCWNRVGETPLRIQLETENKVGKGVFSFASNNVLRVVLLNDLKPGLDVRLTRQADVDGISELQGAPLDCRVR